MMSFFNCGIGYNKFSFQEPQRECGAVDVFGIWKDNVNEIKARNYVNYLRDHYDFPIFNSPSGMEF